MKIHLKERIVLEHRNTISVASGTQTNDSIISNKIGLISIALWEYEGELNFTFDNQSALPKILAFSLQKTKT